MKTLKEFAYIHLRQHGLTPSQALRHVRIAITASCHSESEQAFELAFACVCIALCIPNAFERLLATVSKHY